MKTTYNKQIEFAARNEIERVLSFWLWIVPPWCHSLHVNMWCEPNDGESISIKVNYDYRFAEISFTAGWLLNDDYDKHFQVIHELLHIHLYIIADFAKDNFDCIMPLDEAPRYNQTLTEELRTRHEGATQDLAHVLMQRLYIRG